MPDITKYKSVAISLQSYNELMAMAKPNFRSAGQQIAFLVDEAKKAPSDKQVRKFYASLLKKTYSSLRPMTWKRSIRNRQRQPSKVWTVYHRL